MKVKVYNTQKWIETEVRGYTTFREHSHAVIEGPDGSIMVCEEGVHDIFKSKHEKFETEIQTANKPGTIKIMPDALVSETLKEYLLKCPVKEEVELGEYIRKFGSRLEQNYAILLRSIKEIGLDPKNYPREA